MTPQEIVRSYFPQADAIHRDPVYVMGQHEPYLDAGWVVLSAPTLGAEHLGTGPTEETAWSAAVAALQTRKKGARITFKEWLTEQAAREGGKTQRGQIIAEWQKAVSKLLVQLQRWLEEDDALQVVSVETAIVEKNEEGLGVYDVEALRIGLAGKVVQVIPVARNVAGGVGKQGDLSFKPAGRVDMSHRSQKYMLFRVITDTGKEWVVVDDTDYSVQVLTKQTFEVILQDLLS